MRHKLLTYAGLALLLFYIARNPAGAAATAVGLGARLADLASALGQFLTALIGSPGGGAP